MGNSTGLYQCPACNNIVTFRHKATNYIECFHCNTMAYKDEQGVLRTVAMNSIQDTVGAIQKGTKGVWNSIAFEVLGRVRFWMDETVFNYWTLSLANGNLVMLAEGYGLYSILSIKTDEPSLPNGKLDAMKPGLQFPVFNGQTTIGNRKDVVKRCEAEGEFQLMYWQGKFTIFEFSQIDGTALEFHQTFESTINVYKVTNVTVNELQFSNLRKTPNTEKHVTCTGCRKSIVLKSWPYAQSFVCAGCKRRYVMNANEHTIITGANNHAFAFDLDIGQKATLFDVQYEIIGCVLKEEANTYKSRWKEYCLYNTLDGFAFLSEYNGHWIFVKERKDGPVLSDATENSFNYKGTVFNIYNDYRFRIIDSAGEFANNIYDDDKIEVREFIAPPEMWIREKSNEEGINWFYGRHISKTAMEKAFGKTLPYQTGTGAIQLKGITDRIKLRNISIALVVLAFLIHYLLSGIKQEKLLLSQSISLTDSSKVPFVTSPFTLTRWKSNLELNLSAPVQNNWVSLDISLTNTVTGEEFSIEMGVEYYSGNDGGESWSEGERESSAYLSSIPAGSYVIKIQPSTDAAASISECNINVTYDVPMTKNLIVIMILLLILPVGAYIYGWYSDMGRWENSDFSPYSKSENE